MCETSDQCAVLYTVAFVAACLALSCGAMLLEWVLMLRTWWVHWKRRRDKE